MSRTNVKSLWELDVNFEICLETAMTNVEPNIRTLTNVSWPPFLTF